MLNKYISCYIVILHIKNQYILAQKHFVGNLIKVSVTLTLAVQPLYLYFIIILCYNLLIIERIRIMSVNKITVVVPVYNVGNYISGAVSSLAGQSNRDFDLILVDDGSKDSSGYICIRR